MNISEIYEEEGINGIYRLSAAVGVGSDYLYQLAIKYKGKRPSPELALRLMNADPRLTFDDMYAHIGEHPDRRRWRAEQPKTRKKSPAKKTAKRGPSHENRS